MARFCPLFSGSSGNSIAVGGADSYILIDAGTSARRITSALKQRGLELSRLAAIFVTHEHRDHVSALSVLSRQTGVPVYATAGTLCAASAGGFTDGVEKAAVCPYEGIEAGGIFVKPFPTMHDTVESCGYTVTTADGRRIAVATDMGCVTDTVREAINGCELVYMESNHDIDMLKYGSYPFYLKERILGTRGHLSNEQCAAELAGFAKNGASRFILAHLSRENNRPELARSVSFAALRALGMREGIDFTLETAPPDGMPLLVF